MVRKASLREEQEWPRAMVQKGVGWIEIQPMYLTINVSEKLPETIWKRVLGGKQVARDGVALTGPQTRSAQCSLTKCVSERKENTPKIKLAHR